jgi:FkbM family methyltransferase
MNKDMKLIVRPNNAGDLESFGQVFYDNMFLPLVNLQDIHTVIDAGAYVGYVTCYLQQYHRKTRYFCIEPNYDNIQILISNLNMAECKATIHNFALWDKDTRVDLVPDPKGTAVKVKEGMQIPARTVKAFCEAQGIAQVDLLKIDIEGSEKQVFSGDTSWIDFTRNICIELHDAECRQIFYKAMAGYKFDRLEYGELLICKNIKKI